MRLFLAITPDESCRVALARDVAPLREEVTGVRWVRDEHVHATLFFLGEVDEGRRSALARAVGPVVAGHPSFMAHLAGGGAFPNWRRPRIAWIGFLDPEPVGRLAADVVRACGALGFQSSRDFQPHVTLGRVTRALASSERARLEEGLLALTGPYPFAVPRVEVVHSKLHAGGPRHSVIEGWPLGPA